MSPYFVVEWHSLVNNCSKGSVADLAEPLLFYVYMH